MRTTLVVPCSPAPCPRCCHQQTLWPGKASWVGCDQDHLWLVPSESPGALGGTQRWSQGAAAAGRGEAELSRLTPPTCAACGLARPQDLAH